MFTPVTHIIPLATILRERVLPVPGRIVTRVEQKVTPIDVIAEAHLGQEHVLLDVARLLGVNANTASRLIQCKVGEQLQQNFIIAQRPGLVSRTVRAPCEGRVVASGGGQVLLEIGEGTFQVLAGIPGTVTRLIPERGAEILAVGALIQGVWGNGQINFGPLMPLMASPEDKLEARQLDVSLRGSIILGGSCSDPDVLHIADELPVRGLILGGISPSLLPIASKMSYPIIIIDGFGTRPLNSLAFKLLTSNIKREVSMNAGIYNRYAGTRPEILIPLPTSHTPIELHEVEAFAPGQQVRLCREPNIGEIGSLIKLKPGLTAMPSGLRVAAGEVSLENGGKIVVPLVNLEVIG